MFRLLLLLAIMATWFVDGVNGNDSNAGTAFAQAFKTIGKAESVAAADDTVNICATGTYTITSALTLGLSGDFTSGPVTWIGANASGTVDGTHAAITTSTNGVNLIALNGKNNRIFRYLDLSSTAGAPASGFATSSQISSYVSIKDCSITGCKDGIYAGYFEGPEYLIYSLDVSDTYIANCTRDAVRVAADSLLDAVGLYNNGGKGINVSGAISSSIAPRVTVSRSILAANAVGASVANIGNNSEPILVLQGCTIASQTGDAVDWLAAAGNPVVVVLENTILYGNGGYAGYLANPSGALLSINRYNATGSNTSGSSLPPGTGNVSLTANPFAGGSAPNSLATLRAYYALNSTTGGGASCRAAGYPSYLDIGALQHQDSGGGGSPPATPSLSVTDNGDGTGAVATVTGSTGGSTNNVLVEALPSAGESMGFGAGGSRTGDGTVNLALTAGWYVVRCDSFVGNLYAAPGNEWLIQTTGPPSLAPSGPIALPKSELASLVAGSATFQARTGTPNAAAAAAHVYYTYLRTDDDRHRSLRPYAIVLTPTELKYVLDAGGLQNYLLPEGELLVLLSDNEKYEDITESSLDWDNYVGGVLYDVQSVAALNGNLAITGARLVAIERLPADAQLAEGCWWQALLAFEWQA